MELVSGVLVAAIFAFLLIERRDFKQSIERAFTRIDSFSTLLFEDRMKSHEIKTTSERKKYSIEERRKLASERMKKRWAQRKASEPNKTKTEQPLPETSSHGSL